MEENNFRKAQVREKLFRLDHLRRDLLKPGFLELGLTLGQGQPRILKYLNEKEPRSQKELAQLCRMDVTTISRTLDRMAETGLIERQINPECRRSCNILLTRKGEETAQAVQESFDSLDEMLCRGFSEDELEQLSRWLDRLADNLEPHKEQK